MQNDLMCLRAEMYDLKTMLKQLASQRRLGEQPKPTHGPIERDVAWNLTVKDVPNDPLESDDAVWLGSIRRWVIIAAIRVTESTFEIKVNGEPEHVSIQLSSHVHFRRAIR